MKATERTLKQLLHSGDQYVIPIFQRYYSWTIDNWQKLWDDLAGLLDANESAKRHFLGAIVCVPEHHEPGKVAAYQVIDGQQRLSTLAILLCAIRDSVHEQRAAEIQDTYLIHRYKRDREKYKLFPRLRDRSAYLALVDKTGLLPGGITQAYNFFLSVIAGLADDAGNPGSAEALLTAVVDRLDFVAITLDHENPYKIFKSLNSTGVDLGQEDLIRNEVFCALPIDEQDSFDDHHWRPLERHFETCGALDGNLFVGFFRHALMRHGTYVGENDTYDAFQKAHATGSLASKQVVVEYEKLARLYEIIEGRSRHTSEDVQLGVNMVRELNATTSYPLVLRLLELNGEGTLTDAGLARLLTAIASFVLRRFVCDQGSRTYARWFCAACRELGSDAEAGLKAFLLDKGWPRNSQFEPAFVKVPLYESKYREAVLKRLELASQAASEPVVLSGCWIEHVMPQTLSDNDDGEAWRSALGENWRDLHGIWMHTPGNLTLVGADYNIEMSNRRFQVKHPVLAGSKVYLNSYFAKLPEVHWSQVDIEERGEQLAKLAASIWIAPE